MAAIDALLKRMRDTGAQRLSLSNDRPIALFKNGQAACGNVLTLPQLRALFLGILPEEAKQEIKAQGQCNFVYKCLHGRFRVSASMHSSQIQVIVLVAKPFSPAPCAPSCAEWTLPPVGEIGRIFSGNAPIQLPPVELDLLRQALQENWKRARPKVQRFDTGLNIAGAVAGAALNVDGSSRSTSLTFDYDQIFSNAGLGSKPTQVVQLVWRLNAEPDAVVRAVEEYFGDSLRSSTSMEEGTVLQSVPTKTHKFFFSEFENWNLGVITCYVTEDVEIPDGSQLTLRAATIEIEERPTGFFTDIENQIYALLSSLSPQHSSMV